MPNKVSSISARMISRHPVRLNLSDNGSFYGTASSLGGFGQVGGKVFRVTTNGTFTTLALFTGANGSDPRAGLTLGPDGNYYGTTSVKGVGAGSVFRIGTNGNLTTLAWFDGDNGWSPFSRLLLGSDGSFFGTTSGRGSGFFGNVFQVRTNGTLITLASFNKTNGAYPMAGLVFGSDGHLYGTTSEGGPGGGGEIFRVRLPGGAPLVLQQLQPTMAVYSGQTISLAVLAGYLGPFTYQWMLNETNVIAGATASTYTLSNVQEKDQGAYSCVITGPSGSTTSSNAVLSVLTLAPTGYEAAVLADHPIAYWRLDEPEGAPVAYDHVGGHNGNYHNVSLGLPAHNQYEQDTAASFGPGTNSYVGEIDGVDFSSTGTNRGFSLECWVKGGPQQLSDFAIITKGTADGGEQFDLDSYSGDGGFYRWFVRDSQGAAFGTGYAPVTPDNTWQHLVAVYDGPGLRLRLYVNGIQVASGPASPDGLLSTPHPVTIGSRQSQLWGGPYDLNFKGMIDEVAIYDYALNTNQVLGHYSTGTAGLAVLLMGSQLDLTWPRGVLQSAPDPSGPYEDIANAVSP